MAAIPRTKWFPKVNSIGIGADIISMTAILYFPGEGPKRIAVTPPGDTRVFPSERVSVTINGVRHDQIEIDCSGLDVTNIDIDLIGATLEPGDQVTVDIGVDAPGWEVDGYDCEGMAYQGEYRGEE